MRRSTTAALNDRGFDVRRSVERRDRAGTCLEHGEEGITTV
jgi:hypothetical protein